MPLGVLRRKASFKDTRHNHQPRDALGPTTTPEPPRLSTSTNNDLLRPESAASRRYPAARSLQSPRQSLAQRPPSAGAASINVSKSRQRLTFMRSRYASDPQLSARYKYDGSRDSLSDAAPPPTIGVTAPSSDYFELPKKPKGKLLPFFRSKTATSTPPTLSSPNKMSWTGPRPSADQPRKSNAWSGQTVDGAGTSSETASAISRGDSADAYTYDKLPYERPKASSFFKFTRRKRKEDSLFPLHADLAASRNSGRHVTPRSSYSPAPSVASPIGTTFVNGAPPPNTPEPTSTRFQIQGSGSRQSGEAVVPDSMTIKPVSAAVVSAGPTPTLQRNASSTSNHSIRSASFTQPPIAPGLRSRSNTMNSFPGMSGHERKNGASTLDSGRASTTSTTLGRNSMAGLRSLTSRLRHPSEPVSPHHFSPSNGASATPTGSANHSFAISRETLVVPDREEGESAVQYFGRLEQDFPKKSIAMAFSKSSDTFSHDVLRSLMRTFKFYEEPMDISMRRFLWEIDLPGEAQQIDRVISAFAERYHECNPHIFETFDEAYLIAYSLIILHSDLFNKNNKHKMQRSQYQKNTRGHGVHEEILGYFYDNIQYTEFIAQNVDDDESDKKAKSAVRKAKKATSKLVASDGAKTGKLDPYSSIIDDNLRLDILRGALRDVLNLDDCFNYLGTAPGLNFRDLRNAFSGFGVLQVVSSRSRPDAFADPMTMTNPMESPAGLVDIKVVKVGTLWRKEAKKKKGRSPWQEWGAILTPAQLYFFRNHSWAKGLVTQYIQHAKHEKKGNPVIFKPPLEEFKFDASVATTNATALQDTTYKKHKHAFVLARKGDLSNERPHDKYFEEVLLADNESEMNDWLARLNYAATCMTMNVHLPPRVPTTPGNQKTKESRPRSRGDESTASALSRENADDRARDSAGESAIQRLLHTKLALTEESIKLATQKLDENMKTARHLEILAPFPNKTRGDLLSFGVRMAHNIKWSHYDVLRSKCQRDILAGELELDDGQSSILAGSESDIVPRSSLSDAYSSGVGRTLSKATANPNRSSLLSETAQLSPRIAVSRASLSGSSPSASSHRNSVITGIDQAFATPSETLSQFGTTEDGSFRLPPLQLGLGLSKLGSSELADEYAVDTNDETSHRRSSVSSTASSAIPSHPTDVDSDVATPRASTYTEKLSRPSPSDREEDGPVRSSPSHRSSRGMRRSLQRTLRESRDSASSPHHSLNHGSRRRQKGSFGSHSGANTDDGRRGSIADGESLTRRPGSFKVHGKKASVITLGSEWQKVSPEERLRQRRQLAEDGAGGVTKYHTARSSMQYSPGLQAFEDSPSESDFADGTSQDEGGSELVKAEEENIAGDDTQKQPSE